MLDASVSFSTPFRRRLYVFDTVGGKGLTSPASSKREVVRELDGCRRLPVPSVPLLIKWRANCEKIRIPSHYKLGGCSLECAWCKGSHRKSATRAVGCTFSVRGGGPNVCNWLKILGAENEWDMRGPKKRRTQCSRSINPVLQVPV
jgi:hypothetical protein